MSAYQKPKGSYISYFSNMVKQHGGINLAQGIPGFDPPVDLIESLKDSANLKVHQYAPGMGNFQLLQLIADKYNLSIENILIVQGATESLSLIYTYINKKLNGDFAVLSFEPAYESYLQLPRIFGQDFIHFPLDSNYSFDSDMLSNAIKKHKVKLVFISSPGNPYGKIWSRHEIDELIRLSITLDFYIVFDAVYEQLYFNEPPYIPIDKLSPNLFIVNSFSKMLCITGWRIGYLIAHESHMEGIKSIHDYIGLCAPSLLQHALVGYLEKSDYADEFTHFFRENVKKSFGILVETLTVIGFSIPPIQGGCFVWAKLPDGWADGFDFASRLYEEQMVAVIPGEHFSGDKKEWIRFNIARPQTEVIAACNGIKIFFETHKA
ncbi:MAG: pyridoxal phosphate-dependent aminotransferase [Bacteroidales bacterium]|nr:MAG: pyridoxal phosphate-dependent aminotransferase [Bacteroidales bacterium]